jgi:hypothetical protein
MKGTQDWGYGFNLITSFPKKFEGFLCFPHPAKK